MTQNAQTGMASVSGAELYYELAGEGPTLVLAHANPADRTMWDDQMDALSARYLALRYDQRGFGQSGAASVSLPSPALKTTSLVLPKGRSRTPTIEAQCRLALGDGGDYRPSPSQIASSAT